MDSTYPLVKITEFSTLWHIDKKLIYLGIIKAAFNVKTVVKIIQCKKKIQEKVSNISLKTFCFNWGCKVFDTVFESTPLNLSNKQFEYSAF